MGEDFIKEAVRLAHEAGLGWGTVLLLVLAGAVLLVLGKRIGLIKWPGKEGNQAPADENGPPAPGTDLRPDGTFPNPPGPPPEDHGG